MAVIPCTIDSYAHPAVIVCNPTYNSTPRPVKKRKNIQSPQRGIHLRRLRPEVYALTTGPHRPDETILIVFDFGKLEMKLQI